MEVGRKELGTARMRKKNIWMTDEILGLMEQRREVKDRDRKGYKELNREIQRKIKTAKEDWLKEQCTKIEKLQELHDSFNIQKKVKEMVQGYTGKQSNILTDEQGNVPLDEDGANILRSCSVMRDIERK